MIEGWPVPVSEAVEALGLRPGDPVAFDADDTLWDGDLGIGLLEWASTRKVLAAADGGKGAFARYQELRAADEARGLEVCATFFAGLPVARVAELAEAHFRERMAARVFPAIRTLLVFLASRGAAVYVVSASPRFAVLPGTRALGIPDAQVAGIELAAEGGVYRDHLAGPITWRAEKALALVRLAGRGPVLAAGNGSNDLELLASATGLAIAVNPSTSARRDGEASLHDAARARGWPIVRLSL